ncbi:MAG: S8 family serine peptidase [Anaerolineae bacterium]|nr:S8 family serine peptidase [Anaerolineae bacterium]
MKQIKVLYLLGLLALLVSIMNVPVAATNDTQLAEATFPKQGGLEAAGRDGTIQHPPSPGEPAVYIIQLQGAPVASYRGGVAGLEATNPAARGERKLDVNDPVVATYRQYLTDQQNLFISAMEQAVGHPVEILYRYKLALNGMAVRLTAAEAAQIAGLDGVLQVLPEQIRYPLTDAGPTWIGAPGIWDGSTTGGLPGTMGEGVIVGILDTGINHDHPSFAQVGPVDGYVHVNPFGSGNFVGYCVANPSFCNDKLIGAWNYTDGPEDNNGHGSHTASTTAGNFVTGIISAPTAIFTASISGVAPHANIIAYDVCSAGCPEAGSIAATEQAISDTVDVINFSIGGGPTNPWLDLGALAFLGARDAGIMVATSAGNNGPGEGTVGSPANAPWLLSVGASTHNRIFANALIDMVGGTAPDDMYGQSITAGYGPAEIVHARDFDAFPPGDPDDGQCLTPFPAGTWTNGEIVVCDRGTIARVDKGANVLAGGAGGFVLANVAANGESVNADAHYLPAVHLGFTDSDVLRTWLTNTVVQTATIAGTWVDLDPANGDIMAAFSSRGENPSLPEVIKPDVIAPGLGIFAASMDGYEYESMSGTSMASPHAAGSAALLTALHPEWTPSEIQSVLMSTAWNATVLKEDAATPADPFDMGAGRIDLSQAGIPGLVLDETIADFLAADPSLGGDPKTLNLASMGDAWCLESCGWMREVASTLPYSVTWTASVVAPPGMTVTVTPNSFELGALGTQAFSVTADVTGLPINQWVFAELVLAPTTAFTVPAAAHLPIAVMPSAGPPTITVDPATMEPFILPDDTITEPLTIGNLGDSPLEWEVYEDTTLLGGEPQQGDWFEDWDSYPTGQDMHGLGGWKGWGNDPAYTAFTTDTHATSAPNSIDIVADADLVHEYTINTGLWRYTAWQYIPGDFDGESYFILLNQYDDAGATNNWSTQVHAQSATGLIIVDGECDGSPLPMIQDQWVELRVEIDLINDWQEIYYDDQLLGACSWSEGMSGGGITSIGAVDLFANGASSVYYDDLSLIETTPETCDLINNIPWVSLFPEEGATLPGESSIVDVTFDSAGLGLGYYTGTLCIASNDPVDPLVMVPLTMTVVECVKLTDAAIDGPAQLAPGEPGDYSVDLLPHNATEPIDILWSNGMTGTSTTYSWPDEGTYTIDVTATNCAGSALVTATLEVTVDCVEVLTATISGPAQLMVGEEGAYTVTWEPPNATPPILIAWSNGMTGTTTVYSWTLPGAYTIAVSTTNCADVTVVGTFDVVVSQYYIYLPIITKNE